MYVPTKDRVYMKRETLTGSVGVENKRAKIGQ